MLLPAPPGPISVIIAVSLARTADIKIRPWGRIGREPAWHCRTVGSVRPGATLQHATMFRALVNKSPRRSIRAWAHPATDDAGQQTYQGAVAQRDCEIHRENQQQGGLRE